MAKRTSYNVSKLLEEKLIRRIPPSKDKASESLRTAESWLKEAKNNLSSKALRSCIISSYLAMFHSARSMLFADGFREKSHFAVARYLEDRYKNNGKLEEKWINLLDHFRETRHNDQYSTTFLVAEDDAESALKSAKEFVERMKELAGKK